MAKVTVVGLCGLWLVAGPATGTAPLTPPAHAGENDHAAVRNKQQQNPSTADAPKARRKTPRPGAALSGRIRFIAKPAQKRAAPVARQRRAFQPRPGTDVLIQAEREIIRRLRLAEQSIERKQYVQAVTLLQAVIDRDKDAFFYPDPEKRDVLQSVRMTAQTMIADMPEKGRNLYELKVGGKAQGLMDEALKSGGLGQLQEVTRRFFHTQAGYQSSYRLGILHLDRDEPLAAALCLSRLRKLPDVTRPWEPQLTLRTALAWHRAGLTDKAKQVLAEFRQLNGRQPIDIGGRSVRPFDKPDNALAWLSRHFGRLDSTTTGEAHWALFGGNESRNGRALLPKQPDAVTWKRSTIIDPLEPYLDERQGVASENVKVQRRVVDSLITANRKRNTPAIPKGHPLVLGETLIHRTTSCVRAVSLKDGSTLWHSPTDLFLERLLSSGGEAPVPSPSGTLQAVLKQRLWSDLTWGTLSSDGKRLYCIEETGYAFPTYNRKTRQRTTPKPANRLMALDLATGRIVWELGGQTDDLAPAPMAGTYFLGVPLPLGKRLYVLAEVQGEIRLLALAHREEGDGDNRRQRAEVLWSQPLVGANVRITQDAWRRTSGASISYADGVMVCHTAAGYCIGVDVTSRSLLWAFRYRPKIKRRPRPNPRPRPPGPRPQQGPKWADSAPRIAGGKVLLTPRRSDQLYCLNLLEGSLAWKQPRGDGRYVSGVVDGKVIIAGTGSIRALKLSDGSPAWKQPVSISQLSGRALIAGDRLFVPSGADGIVVIDVADGSVQQKVKLPDNRRPGNLVISGGTMITQRPDEITVFPVPKGVEEKTAGATRREF